MIRCEGLHVLSPIPRCPGVRPRTNGSRRGVAETSWSGSVEEDAGLASSGLVRVTCPVSRCKGHGPAGSSAEFPTVNGAVRASPLLGSRGQHPRTVWLDDCRRRRTSVIELVKATRQVGTGCVKR